MLQKRQCYRKDNATEKTMLQKRQCYRKDNATEKTMLQKRQCYRKDNATEKTMLQKDNATEKTMLQKRQCYRKDNATEKTMLQNRQCYSATVYSQDRKSTRFCCRGSKQINVVVENNRSDHLRRLASVKRLCSLKLIQSVFDGVGGGVLM